MNKEELLDHITEIVVQKFDINQTTKVMLKEINKILNAGNYEYENNRLTWQNQNKTQYKAFLIEENRLSYYGSIIRKQKNKTEENSYLTVCENKNGKISTHKSKKTHKKTYTPFETTTEYKETLYHDYYDGEKITGSTKETTEIDKTYDKENNLKTDVQTYSSNLVYQISTGEYLTMELKNNQTRYYICDKCPIIFKEEDQSKENNQPKDQKQKQKPKPTEKIEKTEISKETFENLMKKSYDPYLLVNDDYYYDYKDGFKIKWKHDIITKEVIL